VSRVRVAWSRCEGELEVAARERLGVVKIRSQVKITTKRRQQPSSASSTSARVEKHTTVPRVKL